MKTIKFTKEQEKAILAYERTGKVIAETSYGTINTHALDFKAVAQVYFEVYEQKINTTCVTCCIDGIKRIYNDYAASLKPAPKVKKPTVKKPTAKAKRKK